MTLALYDDVNNQPSALLFRTAGQIRAAAGRAAVGAGSRRSRSSKIYRWSRAAIGSCSTRPGRPGCCATITMERQETGGATPIRGASASGLFGAAKRRRRNGQRLHPLQAYECRSARLGAIHARHGAVEGAQRGLHSRLEQLYQSLGDRWTVVHVGPVGVPRRQRRRDGITKGATRGIRPIGHTHESRHAKWRGDRYLGHATRLGTVRRRLTKVYWGNKYAMMIQTSGTAGVVRNYDRNEPNLWKKNLGAPTPYASGPPNALSSGSQYSGTAGATNGGLDESRCSGIIRWCTRSRPFGRG